jgi:hypothetical protein
MWNPFKKEGGESDEKKGNFAMNMMSKIAMRRLEKMSPKEREKMIREAMTPKNKDKMLAAMEQMKKAGQISDDQYRMAKKKLGF